MPSRRLLSWLCTLMMMIGGSSAWATSFVLPTWRQMAQEADFIGVVKCVTAGGIVARYRVEESWRGLAKGSEFLMHRPADDFGDQYPTLLCGDRMLVMVAKMPVVEFGDSGSLFWTMPADYTAMFFGTWDLESEAGFKESFGASVNTVKDVELLVRRFLEASEGEQERDVILSVAARDHRRFLNFIDFDTPEKRKKELEHLQISEEDLAKAKVVMASLQKQPDVNSLVTEMIRIAPEDKVLGIWGFLERGGGKVVLKLLNAVNSDTWPEAALRSLNDAKEAITRRLDPPSPAPSKEDVPVLTKENLGQARAVVDFYWADKGGGKDPLVPQGELDPAACVQLLILHDPDFLSEKLLTWSRTGDRSMSDWTYGLVRDFCWNCGKDREAQFTKLQKAQDPFVRVMAAIYLCFENKESGLTHLKACSQLPGDEGAWAALTLARRGDKEALSRALQVFSPDEQAERATYNRTNLHYILQQRLMILLSNSAHAGGLPAPPSFDNYSIYYPEFGAGVEARSLLLKALSKWWAEHSDAILLHDPWLDVLDKAKRD